MILKLLVELDKNESYFHVDFSVYERDYGSIVM